MDSKSTRIIEAARELLKHYGYFVDNLWHVDDVHFICEQHDLEKISDQEAMEIFTIAHAQFDGEHGISWPQLEKALHTFFKRKAALKELSGNSPA